MGVTRVLVVDDDRAILRTMEVKLLARAEASSRGLITAIPLW
jgi:hypothetical protein